LIHLGPRAVQARIAVYQRLSNAGKLIVLSAANAYLNQPQRNAGGEEAGLVSPINSAPRETLAPAQAWKKNAMAVSEASTIAFVSQFEGLKSTSNYGSVVSVCAQAAYQVAKPGGTVRQDADGTSFSTPIVAGIAAELMLVDPTLQQPANIVKVAEYIEATCDPIGAPVVNQWTGHGRPNFWKAVLAAANKGLSAEGRTPGQNANDSFFQSLPLLGDPNTTWYAFEIRTKVQNCTIWGKLTSNNTYIKIDDDGPNPGQTRPAIPGEADSQAAVAYMSTQLPGGTQQIASGLAAPAAGNRVTLNTAIAYDNMFAGGQVALLDNRAKPLPGNPYAVVSNTSGGAPILTLTSAPPAGTVYFQNLTSVSMPLPADPFAATAKIRMVSRSATDSNSSGGSALSEPGFRVTAKSLPSLPARRQT